MDTPSAQHPHSKELPATCKGALRSPYTMDSNAVQISIDPFDYVDLEKHFQSTVRNCVAAPYDLRTDQKSLEVVPCSQCPPGVSGGARHQQPHVLAIGVQGGTGEH
jgi:hypothetical protein